VTRDSNYVVWLIVSIVRNQLVSRFQLALFWFHQIFLRPIKRP
jgi:hypothetical protein